MPNPSKVILVFCDGTSMDGILGCEGAPAAPGDQTVTNVLRLSRLVDKFKTLPDGTKIPQVILYQPGVGSQSGFSSESFLKTLVNGGFGESYNQALGTFVAGKIREAYIFIAQNYVDGDEICLFGFSRGAYTARKVAGLIDRIGLLTGGDLYKFSNKWTNLVNGKFTDEPDYKPTHKVKVKCVGVWDTVGSVYDATNLGKGAIIHALSIQDCSLPHCVENAFHAVSLQENRCRFLPTLWDAPKTSDGRNIKQVWFLGDHSDVGGGHGNPELSDLSLLWMAGEIAPFVTLDAKNLEYFYNRKDRGAPWGASQPCNAFLDLSAFTRTLLFFTSEPRDTLWKQRTDVAVHSSVEARANPVNRNYKIIQPTPNELKVRNPVYLKLNDLEEELKKKWKFDKKNLPKAANTLLADSVAIQADSAKKVVGTGISTITSLFK